MEHGHWATLCLSWPEPHFIAGITPWKGPRICALVFNNAIGKLRLKTLVSFWFDAICFQAYDGLFLYFIIYPADKDNSCNFLSDQVNWHRRLKPILPASTIRCLYTLPLRKVLFTNPSWGRIHEITIMLWLLGKILRFLRLEVSTFVFVFL